MNYEQSDDLLTTIGLNIDVPEYVLDQFTPMEVFLGESLKTPGLQTSVVVHNDLHFLPIKNLDIFKGATIEIDLERKNLQKYKIQHQMKVKQVIYRLEKRQLYNNSTESFILHACDPSMLDDAYTLVSRQFGCITPSQVVDQVLRSCAGVKKLDIEPSSPARPYNAENIHPFQVVAQQANVALADGDDPSFIHYMTYEELGIHKFRSLKSLVKQPPVFSTPFSYTEVGETNNMGYAYPYGLMTYEFPCDFDLISDLLNGVGTNGQNINTAFTVNPLKSMFNMFGSKTLGCGIGSGNPKLLATNNGSAQEQNTCPDNAKLYLNKRQARMSLLEQDKIAFRCTLPFNPSLHAGKVIDVRLQNRHSPLERNYGSGTYLILAMKHNIKYGGFATTQLDCVSTTAGMRGEV
jgi:hypothetical protein